MQSFHNAVSMYEQLCKLFPDVEDYHLYYAQALYKAGQYDAASRKASQLESEQYTAVYYEQNDIKATQSILDQCLRDDPTTIVFEGAIDFKEGRFDDAKKKFGDAMNVLGYQSDLCYNIALCYFRLKQYGNAMRQIAEIIEKGSESNSDVKSVRNSTVLRETALVEAFNLKAAIEYDMKNFKGARDALLDMPPRAEEELDSVRPVHTKDHWPDILYMKHGFHDLMADVLAENTHLTFQLLSKDFFEFVDASVTLQTSPEEAYRKYDDLATKHVDILRKLTQKIQAARIAQSNEEIKSSLKAYDDALEDFMPVLMAQANIYWDRGNYAQVEKIFRQTAEFCSEHESWKLNVAHVFFLQGAWTVVAMAHLDGFIGNKYEQAIQYYEPFVKKHQAEELLRSIEREEEEEASRDPDKRLFHLCIVNLVIGTLYCSKVGAGCIAADVEHRGVEQLRFWHLPRYEGRYSRWMPLEGMDGSHERVEHGAVPPQARHGHVVLRQAVLPRTRVDVGEAHDDDPGLDHGGHP
ncbi:hypothetical protein DYB32_002780, partial [Aphanomyces invadans]